MPGTAAALEYGGEERGTKVLRCGAKRLVSAFADEEQSIYGTVFSSSTKVDGGRLRPQRRNLFPRS